MSPYASGRSTKSGLDSQNSNRVAGVVGGGLMRLDGWGRTPSVPRAALVLEDRT